ncbi:Peptidase family M23 [Enhygromyxa salina]|uniref:Peptidase family M23 n=1 Tax=Enhygromyxa salina TaxID=215803 RepID=A0A2S9XB97_9BACT|nr:M23 family metallopeptidase [Enhygromyxa salina]PRP90128.1 Peptidase family M23 [Enhygromyxa salina]
MAPRPAVILVVCSIVLGCSEDGLEHAFDSVDSPTELGDDESDTGAESDMGAESDTDEGDETPPIPDPLPEPPSSPASPNQPEAGGCGFDLVWPTTGTATDQTRVHDAFGPRLLAGSYDWHDGIDLPGHADDGGFHDPVYAVADGTIYAIGNRPNPNEGAIASYSESAGNVVIIEHLEADLHPGAPTLYSVYMHLDELELGAFPARLGVDGDAAAQVEVDLGEYYYLGGSGTNAENRGRRRTHFKSSGEPITAYPRVQRQDQIAVIGDSGATYEHLHFEIRESYPTSAHARNPFAYLPHFDTTKHSASLSLNGLGVRAHIEIPRAPGAPGSVMDLSQQLDVELVTLQIRGLQGELLDELRIDFQEIVGLEQPDLPLLDFEGVGITFSPADFDSSSASWQLDIDFAGLAAAGLLLGLGESFSLAVTDVCGNEYLTAL